MAAASWSPESYSSPLQAVYGILVLGDEVAPAQLQRVDADLRRQRVHRPLDGVRGLGPAGAAVGVGRGHCREHGRAREVVCRRQVVDAGVQERAEERDARRDELEVGPHVADQAHPQAGELAVPVGGELDVLDLAATVNRRLGVLGTGLVPAHGQLVPAGQGEAEQLLGIHVELAAEPAADGRRHDPHLVLGKAERDRRHQLEDVGYLRRRVERDVATEGLGHGDDGACLHRHRQQSLLHVALADGVDGGLEGLVDGAVLALDLERPGVAGVGAEVVVDDGGVGERLLQVDHRRQRLVLDLDGLDRVAGGRLAGGDDGDDAVTDVADLAHRQRVVGRVLHVVGDRPRARHRGRPRVLQVSTGVDGDDAGQPGRGRRVDRRDAGMGVRAAGEGEVERTRDDEVVGEAGFAREERRVLPAQEPLADDPGWRVFGDGHRWTRCALMPRRRRGSPARCCGSRCSGRGCPRALRAPRARSGRGSPGAGTSPPSPFPACSSRTGGRGAP